MASDDRFDVGEATVKAKTASALLVEVDGEDIWFPFSQIHDDSELYETSEAGEVGQLVVTGWIARQKGLE